MHLVDPPADLAQYYGDDYGTLSRSRIKSVIRSLAAFVSYRGGVAGRIFGALYHGAHWGTYQAIRQADLSRDAAVLDVGSGSGRFLVTLRKLGFEGELAGVDPFLDVNRIAIEKHDIIVRRMELEDVAGPFDLITMVHVLEHVPDPIESLQNVSRLLAEGGGAVVSIPVAGSHVWKRWGPDWVQLDPPRHMVLLSGEGMKLAAAQAGLKVERVFYDSTAFQFWGTARVRKGRPIVPFAHSIIASVLRAPFDAMRALYYNKNGHGDQCTFLLTRR